jgi:hypothetical protein
MVLRRFLISMPFAVVLYNIGEVVAWRSRRSFFVRRFR